MANDKIIGVYGVSNTCSFNVFNVYDDHVIGGFNAQTLDDCLEYAIVCGILLDDEDGEIMHFNSDFDMGQYIVTDNFYIPLSEVMLVG